VFCCLFSSKSSAEGQTLARGEHNILGSAKLRRKRLLLKGKLPLRGGTPSLIGEGRGAGAKEGETSAGDIPFPPLYETNI